MSTPLKRTTDSYFKALDAKHERLACGAARLCGERYNTASSGTDIVHLVMDSVRIVAAAHFGTWPSMTHGWSSEIESVCRSFIREQWPDVRVCSGDSKLLVQLRELPRWKPSSIQVSSKSTCLRLM